MSDLLYEIYNGDYDLAPKRDRKQQELSETLCAQWDKVQAAFGNEFLDRLLELEAEQEEQRAFHYYRAGVRLGVRLMLEALTSATG